MAAIAVTAGTARFENAGSIEMWTADVTSVDDADTFDCKTVCGFGDVRSVQFNPTTAAVAVPALSNTTVTFKVAAGSLAGRLTVWGK